MIVILEGIDRVGKTTLANIISEEFNIPIYKQERFGGNDVKLNIENNILINNVRTKTLIDFWNWSGFNQHLIMDRFHWTEAVYSCIDRKNTEPMNMLPMVEREMLKQKDKYLIIQVMPVDIKWSSREHGSDLKKHQELFDEIYNKSEMNKYRCTFYSYYLALKEIERRL